MSRKTAIKDIKPAEFPVLSWEEDKIADSLNKLYNYVIGQASQASDWYGQRRVNKKFGGLYLRAGAILATAVAGIIPILGEIFEENGIPAIQPAWATVAIAVAALLIAIDNLGGFTSGWVRYMLTAQKIDQLKESFRFEWEKNKLEKMGVEPQPEQVKQAIDKCQMFLFEVYGEVREETELWAAEFQSAIKEIERISKVAATVQKLGAIDLEVVNGEKCDNGWTFQVDGGSQQTRTGKSASLSDITPKIHTVRVVGEIEGKPVAAEQAILVNSGQVSTVQLTLV